MSDLENEYPENSSGNENEDDEKKTWCICGSNRDEDQMIACDNPGGCKIEWFHLDCVGLTVDSVPEGDWFCQYCTEELKASKQTAKPMVFICEYCEAEFDSKQACLAHKEQHVKPTTQAKKKRQSQKAAPKKPLRSSPYPSEKPVNVPNEKEGNKVPGFSTASDKISENETKQSQENLPPPSKVTETGNKKRPTPAASPATSGHGSVGHAQNAINTPAQKDAVLTPEKQRQLAGLSDEQILAELARRQEAQVCVCGTVFRDQTLYFLHRSTHNTNNPRKCSQCDFVARDWYDFTSHFFVHRKSNPAAS